MMNTYSRPKAWHQDEKFLALRKEWYEKLKDEGFKDIEHTDWSDGSSGNLLDGFSLMDAYRTWAADKQRYYEVAEHHLRHIAAGTMGGRRGAKSGRKKLERGYHKDSLEYRMWEMHAHGFSNRAIETELLVNRVRVAKFLNKERERMLKAMKRRYGTYEENL